MRSFDSSNATSRRPEALHTLLTGVAVLIAAGCEGNSYSAPEQARELADAMDAQDSAGAAQAPRRARAVLSPASGSDVEGQVNFVEKNGAIQVAASVRGLDTGRHGLHIHENGDCSAPDATSAGGHFAPDGDPHGAPDSPPESHHVGDLGNIAAGQDGIGELTLTDGELRFKGENGVVGRAVIVHAEADDLESQPSGAAGPRVACGVVAMVDGEESSESM